MLVGIYDGWAYLVCVFIAEGISPNVVLELLGVVYDYEFLLDLLD